MRFKTVEDILDWTANFHDRVAALSASAAEKQDQERLRLLLDYLAEHQDQLRRVIEKFEVEGADRVLETWFDKAPEIELPDADATVRVLENEDDLEGLLGKTQEFFDRMIDIYANLRNQASAGSIQDVFDSLAELEHSEKRKMVAAAHRLQDI